MKELPDKIHATMAYIRTPQGRKQRLNKYRMARRKLNAHLLTSSSETPQLSVSSRQPPTSQMLKNRVSAQNNRNKNKAMIEEFKRIIKEKEEIIRKLEAEKGCCPNCSQGVCQQRREVEVEVGVEKESVCYGFEERDAFQEELYRSRVQSESGFGFFFTLLTISMCLTPSIFDSPAQNTFVPVRNIEISSRLLNFIAFPPEQQLMNFAGKVDTRAMEPLTPHPKTSRGKIQNESFSYIPKPELYFPKPQTKSTSTALTPYKRNQTCEISTLNKTCSVSNLTLTCLQHLQTCPSRVQPELPKRHKNLSSTPQPNPNPDPDILFCELPRIYRPNKTSTSLLNKEFSLMLDGNILKEIFATKQGLYLSNQSFNGFYEVEVDVKKIKPVDRDSCRISQC